MNESVKLSVEQEKTVQKKSKTSSDKKSAKGTEVFYSSVAYLQSSEIPKDIDNLRKKGHLNKLLNTVLTYDQKDSVELNRTYKSPLQNKGDQLLRENKGYAVVYNSSVGGIYEVYRKVPDSVLRKSVERYGLPDNATEEVKQLIQADKKEKVKVDSKLSTKDLIATSEQQQKFIDEIKTAMGGLRMVVLPDFGTKKGVVAGTDEDKGVSLNRVYAWNDNISFAGSGPGDDNNKRRYYHPENIRPEFYNYLISEVKKIAAPQLITENGQKVTSADLFESTKQEGKYFFYARLDGIGLHPKVVSKQDVDAFMKHELSVKDMFAKYYPSKMAKQLDKDEFDNLKLSDGRELSKVRVYKQRDEEKSHYGQYMLYAEMGDKRFHATPLQQNLIDAYFDKTQSKSQIAEKVLGEQLHLKSAYEKYKLPEDLAVQEVRVRKVPDGGWLISANLGELGQTAERKVSSNDLYSLFKFKTATKEQLGAKYLMEDIKSLFQGKSIERNHSLKI